MGLFKGSEPLVLPTGYVSAEWIREQYSHQLRASQELASAMGKAEVDAKINELYASVGGLQFMGRELRSPLLREGLYEATHRSLIQVYKLGKGEDATFNSDIDVAAAALGVSGLPGQIETTTDYVRVDTRMFMGAPFVRWNISNLSKFDILAATQQRLKSSLMLQEAAAWIRLLQYASGLRSGQGTTFGYAGTTAASNNAPASVPTDISGQLSVKQVATAVARFGGRQIRGQKRLYMHPNRQADLTLFNYAGPGTGGNGFFAPNHQELALAKNNTGTWLGTEVYEDIVVPETVSLAVNSKNVGAGSENVIGYILGPAEYVGLQAIRMDLSIETMKDVRTASDVFCGWSDSGYYIRWCKALQRLTDI